MKTNLPKPAASNTLSREGESCPLCYSRSALLFSGPLGEHYDCPVCRGIFLGPEYLPPADREKERYDTHNNDVSDLRYQQFVAPLVDCLLAEQSVEKAGLDYGCGPGPVISYLLLGRGYSVELYDPFYRPDQSVLKSKYDFIICSEVLEHFHRPALEFERLAGLLRPEGRIYCLTCLYDDLVPFGDWYYKNDPTHVFFYRAQTFNWTRDHFAFADCRIAGRLVVLQSARARS